MKRLLSFLLFASCLAAIMTAGGCAANSRTGTGPDRTQGLTLDMFVRDGGAMWLYDVRDDGSISYAGGQDAAQRRFSWTGTMSDEEIAELRSLVNRFNWTTRQRSRETGDGTRRYTINVRQAGGGGGRFEVRGDREDVAAVNALLHRICLRRLDAELDALPQPGLRPR